MVKYVPYVYTCMVRMYHIRMYGMNTCMVQNSDITVAENGGVVHDYAYCYLFVNCRAVTVSQKMTPG